MSLRVPESHADKYKELADELGIGVAELMVITCAKYYKLRFALEQEDQLKLGA